MQFWNKARLRLVEDAERITIKHAPLNFRCHARLVNAAHVEGDNAASFEAMMHSVPVVPFGGLHLMVSH